jgi:hypothetical protein
MDQGTIPFWPDLRKEMNESSRMESQELPSLVWILCGFKRSGGSLSKESSGVAHWLSTSRSHTLDSKLFEKGYYLIYKYTGGRRRNRLTLSHSFRSITCLKHLFRYSHSCRALPSLYILLQRILLSTSTVSSSNQQNAVHHRYHCRLRRARRTHCCWTCRQRSR